MADWEVDRAQLKSAATKFTTLETTARKNKDKVEALGLTQSDFGRLQWIGLNSRCWEAYEEHTDACVQSIDEMSNAIGTYGEGLTYTAMAYQGMEDASDEVAKKLIEEIVSGGPTK